VLFGYTEGRGCAARDCFVLAQLVGSPTLSKTLTASNVIGFITYWYCLRL
jgi:hypothetical protein